jgi:hypothetical protein
MASFTANVAVVVKLSDGRKVDVGRSLESIEQKLNKLL